MPREESLYPADWIRIAEKDLGRVEHLLGVRDYEEDDVRDSLTDAEALISKLRSAASC